jgi:hypothetical protein
MDLDDEVMDRAGELGRRLCRAHLLFKQILIRRWRKDCRRKQQNVK